MHRIIGSTIFIFFICLSAFSQKQYDFATIDLKMTAHYTFGNWDSVIYYGNAGIADSIDYFYLRKHLGEAYYYKLNYLSAIPHFENALSKNSNDIPTQEFLYYSYLFSGRETDARAFQSRMSDAALKDIKAKKNNCFDNIYLETGTSLNNNFSKNQNNDFNGDKNIYGIAEMSGNVSYGQLGFKALLGHKVSVYAGASILNEQKKTIYDLSNVKPGEGRIITEHDTMVWKPYPMPGYYTYDTVLVNHQEFKTQSLLYNNENTLHQNEFYLNCNIHAAKGLDVMPFIHILNSRLTITHAVNHPADFITTDSIQTHTQFHFPPPPMGGIIVDTIFFYDTTYTVKLSDYAFRQKDTSFTNFSVGVLLNKTLGHFTSSFFGNFSNLNGRRQRQLGAALTWFPYGNLNFYIGTTLTGCLHQGKKNLVINFLTGKKITKYIWLEGNVTLGDMNNFTEKNGFLVNNNPDITTFRFGLTPIITFKNFDIILHYQYQEKQGSYFFKNESKTLTEGTFNYQNHVITGGIKWKI